MPARNGRDVAASLPEAAAPASPAVPHVALELELTPEAAARLPRLQAIAAARVGRGRGAAEEIIFQDSADGRLAAAGLVLEVPQRGPRRLLRSLPPAGAFTMPGLPLPPAPLEQLAELAAEHPLVPLVAFTGRRLVLKLAEDVTCTLRQGRLRSVADEAPAARLLLNGPLAPVFHLARALAAELGAQPPRASLAEAGRALALATPLRPRCRGAPDLSGSETVGAALATAIGHLGEALLFQAPEAAAGATPEGVHQLRVAARRLRSVLKVFRAALDVPTLAALDGEVKALATLCGPARDWDVFLGGLGADLAATAGTDRRLAGLLRAAAQRRDAAYAAMRQGLAAPRFRLLLLDLAAVALAPPWPAAAGAAPLRSYAEAVLDKRWRRLAAAGAEIGRHDAEALHEMRLDAKRLRYAAELFAPLWPGKAGRRFLRRLSALQEALGLANDVSVARALVASLATREAGRAWAVGLAEGWALARGRKVQGAAVEAWKSASRAELFWN